MSPDYNSPEPDVDRGFGWTLSAWIVSVVTAVICWAYFDYGAVFERQGGLASLNAMGPQLAGVVTAFVGLAVATFLAFKGMRTPGPSSELGLTTFFVCILLCGLIGLLLIAKWFGGDQ